METYNMNRKMSWTDFKRTPPDIQKEFVQKMRNFYNASDSKIAEMFGVAQATVSTYFKEKGLSDGVVRKMSARQKASWERFLTMSSEPVEKHVNVLDGFTEDDVPDTEVSAEEVVKVLEKKIPLASCKLVMTGDVYGVCKRVVEILGANTTGEITVYFNAKETKDEKEE